MCSWPTRCTILTINFIPQFFCLLYMFRTNLVVHHQEHSIIYCITQFGTIGTIVLSGESSCFEQLDSPDSTIVPIVLCNAVYYAVLLMVNDWIRSKHVEQVKNCGIKLIIKIDYKNCAFRWSLTHCYMICGTHNVKVDRKFWTEWWAAFPDL